MNYYLQNLIIKYKKKEHTREKCIKLYLYIFFFVCVLYINNL